MSTKRAGVDRAELARAEVAGASLNDARLTERLEEIVEALALRPGESLPKAMGGEAELEAAYRFLGNEKVSTAAVLGPHIDKTRERCSEHARFLVVMDTTEVRYGPDGEGLGCLRDTNGRGVLAHVGLAVVPGTREPLGVVHAEVWTRGGPKKHRKQATGAADSEALRWSRGTDAVHDLLPGAVCVMDREADIFALVRAMRARAQDFVVRAYQNRPTLDGPMWDALDDAELITTREVEMTEKKPRRRKSERKTHPARAAHTATLEVRARRVTVHGPKWSSEQNSTTQLNLVHVIEREPPQADAAVEWILLTSLPVATKEEVDFVVDAYRARWVIEDFFKALKSGCAIEKRQLEGLRSVANMIAVSLPIAWLLLRLRHLSRTQPHRVAIDVLSPLMLRCLRILLVENHRKPLPKTFTERELTWAIAGVGGHITNNGEPGLLVLGRGLADLLAATRVASALARSGLVINP